MQKSIKNRTFGAETFSIFFFFFLSVRKAVELRCQCPGVGPRRRPHLLSAGYTVSTLLAWGSWRGWYDLCPSKRKSRHLSTKLPPASFFTRMSYRPVWASIECPLSSNVCHYLWDWCAPCSRVWEKGMATHSRILAWRIPRTEEPGGPQPTGSQRVGHDWVTSTHQMREQHTKGRSCPLQLPTQIPSQSLESGARLIDVCAKNQEGRNLPLHYHFLFPMVNQLNNN